MPSPEYVVCCSLSFLSRDGEAHLRQQLEMQKAALQRIAEGAELNPKQTQEIAREALEAEKPYPSK